MKWILTILALGVAITALIVSLTKNEGYCQCEGPQGPGGYKATGECMKNCNKMYGHMGPCQAICPPTLEDPWNS